MGWRRNAIDGEADPPAGPYTSLAINGSSTNQTIDGFGININSALWTQGSGDITPYLDAGVQELGASQWRVVVEEAGWKSATGDTPSSVYSSTTQFTDLWGMIGYLNGLGITDGITIAVMGQADSWMGQPLTNTSGIKNDWAEQIASMVHYCTVTLGLQIGAIGANNEQDHDIYEGVQMSTSVYADCLDRLVTKMNSLGVSTSIKVAGPDCADNGNTWTNYANAMNGASAVWARTPPYLGGHNYGGAAGDFPTTSASLSKRWFMTELATFTHALSLVDAGASGVTMWDYCDAIYNHALRRGDTGYGNDEFSPGDALISYDGTSFAKRSQYWQFCHLYRHVRPGAVYLDSQTVSSVTIYRFKHVANGTITIMGTNASGSSKTLEITPSDLPANPSSLKFFLTNGGTHFQQQASSPLISGKYYAVVPNGAWFTLTNEA